MESIYSLVLCFLVFITFVFSIFTWSYSKHLTLMKSFWCGKTTRNKGTWQKKGDNTWNKLFCANCFFLLMYQHGRVYTSMYKQILWYFFTNYIFIKLAICSYLITASLFEDQHWCANEILQQLENRFCPRKAIIHYTTTHHLYFQTSCHMMHLSTGNTITRAASYCHQHHSSYLTGFVPFNSCWSSLCWYGWSYDKACATSQLIPNTNQEQVI